MLRPIMAADYSPITADFKPHQAMQREVEKHQADEIAASDLQATADNMPPRTLQVQVSMGKANDAAVHSPLGYVAIGDHPAHTETASKLQAGAKKAEARRRNGTI